MDRDESTRRFYDSIWPHAALVLRSALILTRNQAEADDLAQETMLKAFKSIAGFQEGTNVKAWLLTILRNTRIDRLRSAAATHAEVSLDQISVEPEDTSMPPAGDPAVSRNPQAMLESFSDQHMIDALRKLPLEICWTLLLVDVEGLDHSDAAGILGVPVGTVKSRAHRGRAMLRDALVPLARDLGLLGRGTG